MLEFFFGSVQPMCPSHKTENLESCGFLWSVYRYMCDFLDENLSSLSHLPLTQSPSVGKNELSSERLLADNPMAARSQAKHPGAVSSEAFQTFLKERNPLSVWVLSLARKSRHISKGASYPINIKKYFLQVHIMVSVYVYHRQRKNLQNGAEGFCTPLI